MAPREITFRFTASRSAGPVAARLLRPPGARWLYVMAHGAGAGMDHPFLEAVAGALAERHLATMRYQFPYMQAGRRRPDVPALLTATVRSAVAAAAERAPDLALVAGGKSMGGRMTSSAAAGEPLPGVAGLVLLGFPLHPAGKPATERAEHLARVEVPMLFLQGTRDRLADLALLEPVMEDLGPLARPSHRASTARPYVPESTALASVGRPRRTDSTPAAPSVGKPRIFRHLRPLATNPGETVGLAELHVVEGADHGFAVSKRSGRSEEEVLSELADAVAAFCAALEERPC